MKKNAVSAFALLGLFAAMIRAAEPSTELYPFRGSDLTEVRAKASAEATPASMDLLEAWRIYRELQGSWMPGAPKPRAKSIDQLDLLKGKLEAQPKPKWLLSVLESPGSGQARLADKIGDQVFEQQKATHEYQTFKALAIVYLTEHELDRPDAANNAGMYLTALSITHPWDWEVHGLYSRLLLDAKLYGPGWEAAKQSLFLNPAPTLEDLKYFAFIGSIAAKEQWSAIQVAIRQATADTKLADQAIEDSARLFSSDTKVKIVAPKRS